jgi:hypothetical protein
MTTRTHQAARLLAVALAALAMGTGAARAFDPPPDYTIDWSTIDSGGTVATDGQGGWSLEGTIGQADAHNPQANPGFSLSGGYWPSQGFCATDYNQDGFLNLDDLGDFITDFYTQPPIPGGVQPDAPTYPDIPAGYSIPCPNAPDAPAPYAINAYRDYGYRVGYSLDGSNSCPISPDQAFPNLDNLGDYITAYYATGC